MTDILQALILCQSLQHEHQGTRQQSIRSMAESCTDSIKAFFGACLQAMTLCLCLARNLTNTLICKSQEKFEAVCNLYDVAKTFWTAMDSTSNCWFILRIHRQESIIQIQTLHPSCQVQQPHCIGCVLLLRDLRLGCLQYHKIHKKPQETKFYSSTVTWAQQYMLNFVQIIGLPPSTTGRCSTGMWGRRICMSLCAKNCRSSVEPNKPEVRNFLQKT